MKSNKDTDILIMQYHSTLSPSDKTSAQGMCHGLAFMHDSGKHNSPKHNVKSDLTQVINIGRAFGKDQLNGLGK